MFSLLYRIRVARGVRHRTVIVRREFGAWRNYELKVTKMKRVMCITLLKSHIHIFRSSVILFPKETLT